MAQHEIQIGQLSELAFTGAISFEALGGGSVQDIAARRAVTIEGEEYAVFEAVVNHRLSLAYANDPGVIATLDAEFAAKRLGSGEARLTVGYADAETEVDDMPVVLVVDAHASRPAHWPPA